MITPDQIRAARALLRLDQRELAQRAHVSVATLRRVESGAENPRPSQHAVSAVQHALEAAGVEFIENGVRRPRCRSREEVEERVRRIMEIAANQPNLPLKTRAAFPKKILMTKMGCRRDRGRYLRDRRNPARRTGS
jgi:transcriptional regulator with XRE-family HTH domain